MKDSTYTVDALFRWNARKKAFRHLVAAFLAEEDGPTAVEYAVMLGMVLMATIGAIGALSSQTGGMWGGIVGQFRAFGMLP